jgi:uncharacterized membrane protein
MFIGWFIFQGPGADAIRRLNYRVGENTPAGVAEPVPAARVGHESNPPGPQRTAPSLTTAASSPAAANGASPVVTFADVAALFAAKCNNCHAGDRPKGGLDLGSRASIVRGGISGPAVVAGKSGESVLWDSVESGSMPPGKARALTVREKQLIRDWIDGGAR